MDCHFQSRRAEPIGSLERFPCSYVGLTTQDKKETSMKREDEYRQLANDVLRRASEEQSAQMRAQWEILSARYMELADQSKNIDDETEYERVPIKEPAKIISCPDNEAATEEARQMPDGADQTLEVWQSDRRVTVIGLKDRARKCVRERGR